MDLAKTKQPAMNGRLFVAISNKIEKICKILKNTCIFKYYVIIYILTVQYPSQSYQFPGRA